MAFLFDRAGQSLGHKARASGHPQCDLLTVHPPIIIIGQIDPNPGARFRLVADQPVKPTADVAPFRPSFAPEAQPAELSAPEALKIVRFLARDSARIVVVAHAKKRQRQRRITRPQIERCVQKGEITEGPYVNIHGNWQMNLTRYAAGEEITCSVAIDWCTSIVVITAF